jgi:hypothetical protein
VEPSISPQRQGELPKANIVQNLGKPTDESELKLLLTTYAYDSQKDLHPAKTPSPPLTEQDTRQRQILHGTTFHIDPPGCKDVDDSFTLIKISETKISETKNKKPKTKKTKKTIKKTKRKTKKNKSKLFKMY